jgi:heme O synthase-like polyprenyltransferase
LVLVAFSLLPFYYGWMGFWYLAGALVFGGIFCWAALRFLLNQGEQLPDRRCGLR